MDKSYTIKELEDVGEKVINWCMDKFGLSKHYNDYPYVEIDMVKIDNPLGEFISDNNEIIIYPNAIDNINDFISTVIHEYTHYMQSPTWYTRYANRKTELTVEEFADYLLRGDPTHPYEIEADEVAKRNWKQCKKEVLNETTN